LKKGVKGDLASTTEIKREISSFSPVSVRRVLWRRGEGEDEGGFSPT